MPPHLKSKQLRIDHHLDYSDNFYKHLSIKLKH